MGRAGWVSAGRARGNVSAFGRGVSVIITTKPPRLPAPSVTECTCGHAECSGQWVSVSHHHLALPWLASPSPQGSGNSLMTNKTPQGCCTVSSTMFFSCFTAQQLVSCFSFILKGLVSHKPEIEHKCHIYQMSGFTFQRGVKKMQLQEKSNLKN